MKTLHIVLNEFLPDYRVLKEASTLVRAGWNVEIFALGGTGLPGDEIVDGARVRRFDLLARKLPRGAVWLLPKFAECVARMIAAGVSARPEVVHAHDLSGLVVGAPVAGLTGARLVYDSHELWSDSNHRSLLPWPLEKGLVPAERLLASRADRTITVSEGIARIMHERLRIAPPVVIRNVPEQQTLPSPRGLLRRALELPEGAVVFLHLGGILPNRGIETILAAFAALAEHEAHLVFLGVREFPGWLALPGDASVRSRIHTLGRVPPREVVGWAGDANAAIVATVGSSASHRYCLPNKLFESLQAGLPVIVSDLPEMAALVRGTGAGLVFADGDAASLEVAMRRVLGEPDLRHALEDAALRAAQSLHWEAESAKLLDLYAGLAGIAA